MTLRRAAIDPSRANTRFRFGFSKFRLWTSRIPHGQRNHLPCWFQLHYFVFVFHYLVVIFPIPFAVRKGAADADFPFRIPFPTHLVSK